MTIDTGKIKLSTKTVMAALTTLTALWQVQQVRDFVIGEVHLHPHLASVAGLISSLWGLLHNPEVQQALGLDGDEAK